MNGWLIATLVLLVGGLAPALLSTARGPLGKRLLGYEVMQLAVIALVLCFAVGVQRTAYIDVALVLAVLSPAAVLVFTRFFRHDD